MIDFYNIKKRLGTMICSFFIIATFQQCSDNSDTLVSETVAYQATIDSLIETIILPIHTEIDSQIILHTQLNKDTFQLARKRIPITKVQFLVSNEYFRLDTFLSKYQNQQITAKTLSEQLKYSQQRVDSLLNSEPIMNFSE